MFILIKDVYNTYKGDAERHKLRLVFCFLISILVACFAPKISDTSLEMMSVAVSILTGFTFTALFSSYAATTADLPAPKDETDRHNLVLLQELESNFRARSKFLILAAMFSLVAMVLLSIEISPKNGVKWIVQNVLSLEDTTFNYAYSYATMAWHAGSFVLRASTLFVFFEAIYTFYRLSETVVAALTIRGEYKESHR